ncbi:MAG: AraC family transcriptional regulator [Lachnospiraceae bacterium]|nr:AraC family transcriptional regulator [Lachnospiraceae bacterium]
MPLPLKAGYHFHYEHYYRPAFFVMSAAEAYTDFYAISYTISGDSFIHSIKGTSILSAGDISITPKNVYHASSYRSDAPREGIRIKFTADMIADLLAVMKIDDFNDLFIDQQTIIHLQKKEQDEVLQILYEMEQEWNSYNKYSEIILKACLHKLIIYCLSKQNGAEEYYTTNGGAKQDKLIQAIAYIRKNLAHNPSLQETANNIAISPSYLSKLFIDCLHSPYSTFVLNEKILYAQKLLVGSNESIAEIAKKAGFSSNAYFSDCFRRTLAISPLQFRKLYKAS